MQKGWIIKSDSSTSYSLLEKIKLDPHLLSYTKINFGYNKI